MSAGGFDQMTMKIFDSDEMKLSVVDPAWTVDEMLAEDGIFFLKDVGAKLGIATLEFKNHARRLQSSGQNSWEVMGIRKTWTHWQVRMSVFRSYFQQWWKSPSVAQFDESWDANTLLNQTGVYLLSDICRKIPFTGRQIRYQMQKLEDPKGSMGVWKDDGAKQYLVDMRVFGPYIKQVWHSVKTP
jgi:hypothetical protein